MQRKASAVWNGDLKGGNGKLRFTDYEGDYSFPSRFEEGKGTNPEELIGAALAGCFSMSFANMLATEGLAPQKVATSADVTIERGDSGFSITKIHLSANVDAPSATIDQISAIGTKAKENCPVSKALSSVDITLDVTDKG